MTITVTVCHKHLTALGTEWAKQTYVSVSHHTVNRKRSAHLTSSCGPEVIEDTESRRGVSFAPYLEIMNVDIHRYCIIQSVGDSVSVTA